MIIINIIIIIITDNRALYVFCSRESHPVLGGTLNAFENPIRIRYEICVQIRVFQV